MGVTPHVGTTAGAPAGFIVAAYGEYTYTPIYGEKFTGNHTYTYNNYFVPRNSLETLNDGC